MGQYFKRLAHRTGLLETAAHTRQTVPAAVHRDVMEISQEISAPVHTTEYGSTDNKVRAPTNATPIQAEASGMRHTAVPPRIESPVPDLFTNNTQEKQDIELTNLESKQLDPARNATAIPPISDQAVENVFNSKGDMFNAADQLSDSPLFAGENPEPVLTAQHGFLENLISSPSGQQFSESTGSKDPEILAKDKVSEANAPLSISEISTLVSGHDERAMSSTNASGLSYIAPSPVPDKISVGSSRQNIEIRIGSVTMEVHQKQPKHPPAARSRPNVKSSGFRPNRYYLRGL